MFVSGHFYSAEDERSQRLGFKNVLLQRARWTVFRTRRIAESGQELLKSLNLPGGKQKMEQFLPVRPSSRSGKLGLAAGAVPV